MTLAHLSDTHLGYRAYGKSNEKGVNQREVDMMRTFRACLQAILERDPDLVIHSGDLFHVVRPSNMTVVAAFQEIARFQAARNHRPMVIIGGNHDTPRTSDSGNILKLFSAIPGVHVVTDRHEVLEFDDPDVEVLCVPDNSIRVQENIEYTPTKPRKHGILVLHGVDNSLIKHGAGDLEIDQTRHERWSYVALGDYHIFKQYGPNICYSGSTDFASTNIWEESTQPKGWVWFDTEIGKLERVPLATREVIDLPRIDALRLDPEEVAKRIQKNADWTEGSLPIVRQRIINAHPNLRGRLDQSVVRAIAERALHYQLDFSPPEAAPDQPASSEHRSGKTLEQSWAEHLDKAAIPPGIERTAVKDLGFELMKEVDREATPVEA